MAAPNSNEHLRPVVAFDVDGVLRVPDGYGVSTMEHEITFRRDEYPDLWHGQPRWNSDGTSTSVLHFSLSGIEFLREMVQRDDVDAVWATTWQRWANFYFMPLFGLPEIPVAVKRLEPVEKNWFRDSPEWKSSQLCRQFDRRPLLWVDDNMPGRPYMRLDYMRRPRDRAITLAHETAFYTGITREDADSMRAWVDAATTEEGQAEMRKERRRAQQWEYNRHRATNRRWDREQEVFQRSLTILGEKFSHLGEGVARELARLSRLRTFCPEQVEYVLRFEHDPERLERILEVYDALRVPRYHERFEFFPEDE